MVVDIKLDAKGGRGGAHKTVRYPLTPADVWRIGLRFPSMPTCPSCGGRGHIDVDLSFLFGAGTFQTVCPGAAVPASRLPTCPIAVAAAVPA
ncbi:MAG: hypothetical protein ACLU0O_04445 [Collinsella sp.]